MEIGKVSIAIITSSHALTMSTSGGITIQRTFILNTNSIDDLQRDGMTLWPVVMSPSRQSLP